MTVLLGDAVVIGQSIKQSLKYKYNIFKNYNLKLIFEVICLKNRIFNLFYCTS